MLPLLTELLLVDPLDIKISSILKIKRYDNDMLYMIYTVYRMNLLI